MPELPEVETLRLGLSPKIIGLKIKSIEVLSPKSFSGDTKILANKKISNVWRKAKVLGIEIGDQTLLIHLKMSGQLILTSHKRSTINDNRFVGGHPTKDMFLELPNKSTRVVFTFNNGDKLYFNDQRKFGWIKLVNSSLLMVHSSLKNLGPEPLEKSFSWEILKDNLLKHKTQKVKIALLDQTVVSGLGNIYVCEALFIAKINPQTKILDLSDEQFKDLHLAIIKALKNGIKHGGSSRIHFVNEEGKKGRFLFHAFVYSREGEPCKVCQTKIKKIKLGGRGTSFCPTCQSL